MADSIVRLKVENSQYDAKIKRAAQGIQHLDEYIHKAGESFVQTWKKERDFVAGLGKMETQSKSARGKIGELTKAYEDLSVMYNRLTGAEKESEFGKSLNKSLGELKARINNAKSELRSISGEISNNGSLLDQLSSKFGVNITQLATWGGALGAGKVALDVMKDSFFASESNIDEWGRTVEGSKAAYSTFINTINTGDWSGFFDKLNDAIGGARELYDMFDRLGSMKTNNSVLIATLENKLAELRLMKQAGKDVDEQIRSVNAQLSGLRGQEVTQGKNANRQGFINTLTRRGVSEADAKMFWDEFLKHGQKAFDYYGKQAEKLGKNYQYQSTTSSTAGGSFGSNVWTGSARDERKYKAYSAFTGAESELRPFIEGYANTIREESGYKQNEFKYNRWGGASGSGSGGSSSSDSVVAGSIGEIEKKISDLRQKLRDEPAQAVRDQIQEDIKYYGIILKQMRGELGLDFNPKALSQNDMNGMLAKAGTSLGVSQSLGLTIDILEGDTSGLDKLREMMQITSESQEPEYQFNPFRANLEKKFGKFNEETKETGKEIQGVASAFGAVSNALNQLEDPGAKVAGYIASAIGQTAAAFGTAQASVAAQSGWAWLAFAATGLATMITTISGIKSATAGSYADGGIIPGNYTSGDKLTANVNSGELILNRAQQGNLANQLEDTSRGGWGGNVEFSISGRNLVGILKKENNVTRRM